MRPTTREEWTLRRQRLQLVHDRLARVPEEQFYWSVWARSDSLTAPTDPEFSCGTQACVMGYAATIPELNLVGLRLKWVKIPENGGGGTFHYGAFIRVTAANGTEIHTGGFSAAFNLFFLSEEEAEKLCYGAGGREVAMDLLQSLIQVGERQEQL